MFSEGSKEWNTVMCFTRIYNVLGAIIKISLVATTLQVNYDIYMVPSPGEPVYVLYGTQQLTMYILSVAWICNHIHYKVWDEITYPFLNFNGATVEV